MDIPIWSSYQKSFRIWVPKSPMHMYLIRLAITYKSMKSLRSAAKALALKSLYGHAQHLLAWYLKYENHGSIIEE